MGIDEPDPDASADKGRFHGDAPKKAAGLVAALSASAAENPGPRSAEADPLASAPLAAFAASDTGEDASGVLRDVVKRAPFPSFSGLCYEVMGLAWVFGAAMGLVVLSLLFDESNFVRRAVGPLFTVPSPVACAKIAALTLPAILLCVRVAAGLAAITEEGTVQGEGTNALKAWIRGRRTYLAGLGIWLQIFGMMLTATLVLLTPIVYADRMASNETLGVFGVILSGLAASFILVYGAALGALQELSMASLVRHRRGVGSAILHGWRLMRARPRSSQRMAAAEFFSRIAVVAVAIVVGNLVGWPWGLAQLVLFGALVGGLRCHAWGLAYPKIGGLPGNH